MINILISNPPTNLNGSDTFGSSISWYGRFRKTGRIASKAMLCIANMAYANAMMEDCGVRTSLQRGRGGALSGFLGAAGVPFPRRAVVSSLLNFVCDAFFRRLPVHGRVRILPRASPGSGRSFFEVSDSCDAMVSLCFSSLGI